MYVRSAESYTGDAKMTDISIPVNLEYFLVRFFWNDGTFTDVRMDEEDIKKLTDVGTFVRNGVGEP